MNRMLKIVIGLIILFIFFMSGIIFYFTGYSNLSLFITVNILIILFSFLLITILVMFTKIILIPMDALIGNINKVIDGDLSSYNIEKEYESNTRWSKLCLYFKVFEVEKLEESFGTMIDNLQQVIVYLQTSAGEVNQTCIDISATAKQSQAAITEHSATIAQIGTTIAELNQTAGHITGQAKNVLSITDNALKAGHRGIESIEDAIRAMRLIEKISEIVDTVNELAEQSNLLAVNASIEAAKAGESGRGFSVVAAEVRNLAQASKVAAKQIRDILKKSETGRISISSAKLVVEELGRVLEENIHSTHQIATATSQQAVGIKQISEAMKDLVEVSEYNVKGANQLQSTIEALSLLTEELQIGVSRFTY
jgi:methyl-accepting chemotaxis protein